MAGAKKIYTRNPGVYAIVHIETDLRYIGSSIDIHKRKWEHIHLLRRGAHENDRLQRVWNKYGEDAFQWFEIEIVEDKSQLLEREQYWIDFYQSATREHGYNLSPTAGNCIGVIFSKESRQRVSDGVRASGRIVSKGNEHVHAKINDIQVREILERCARGEPHSAIAKDFGITREAVTRIAQRKNWKHVEIPSELEEALKVKVNKVPRGEDNINAKFSEDDVRMIKSRLLRGDSITAIAKEYNVHNSTITAIKHGRWAHITDVEALPGKPIRLRAPRIPRKKNTA